MLTYFIVKSSTSNYFSFFYNEGLCFSKQLSPSFDKLLESSFNDFDIIIDQNDVTHIISQDNTGNVIYLNNDNATWK